MSHSHHSSISTTEPRIHYSIKGIKSTTHLVKVNASTDSLFYPKSLKDISVGDTVNFHTDDGLFSLFTTSLESPRNVVNRAAFGSGRVGNFPHFPNIDSANRLWAH